MSATKWILTILASTTIVGILGTASFTVVYFFIQDNADTPVASVQAPQSVPLDADVIFDLVNQERIKAGVKPLTRDARLDATAQERADDMVTRNYFSHFDPITGGKMIDEQDGGCHFSENIVWIKYETPQEDNQEAVSWWLNSKSHREAMLNQSYTNSGIAINNKRIVQHFCAK